MRNDSGAEILAKTGSDAADIVMSRRTCLGAAAAIGAGALVALAPGAHAQTKMKQAAVKYQDTPKGQAKCSGCALFQAPDACKNVEGKISPEGWCSIYSAKT